MTRFIAGIIATLLVQLIGWPRIEAAFKAAGQGAQTAYTAAETQLKASGVSK